MAKIKEIRLEPIGYVKRKTRDEDVGDRSLPAEVVIKSKALFSKRLASSPFAAIISLRNLRLNCHPSSFSLHLAV